MSGSESESERINRVGREARINTLADCVSSVVNADVALGSIVDVLAALGALMKQAQAQGHPSIETLFAVAVDELETIVTDLRAGLHSERSVPGDAAGDHGRPQH